MKRPIWSALTSYWTDERGLSVLLCLLIVLVFVLPPAGLVGPLGRLTVDLVATLLTIAGAMTVSRSRVALALVATFALTALVVRTLAWLSPTREMDVARALSLVATTGILAIVVLGQVLRNGPVNLHRILGAIAVYLLLGLAWAGGYEAFALAHPGAFSGLRAPAATPDDWIYFSFVTLTTVGYGDITPVAPAARSLALLEALTGQLYPAILLARLVSLQLLSRDKS